MLNKYKKLIEQKKETIKKVENIIVEIRFIEAIIKKNIIENKLYQPIENLENYPNMKVNQITLINKEGQFISYDRTDETELDIESEIIDGHFFYQDIECSVEYDEKTKKYWFSDYGRSYASYDEPDDIIGYIGLKAEKINTPDMVELMEGQNLNLIIANDSIDSIDLSIVVD